MATDRISPTAHYTGTAWVRAGLSPASLATPQGRLLHAIVNPFSHLAAPATAGLTLEQVLRQRHMILDALLLRAVRERGVTQIVEIASGLSGRAQRLLAQEARIARYVECDLPAMADRKRQLLARTGAIDARLDVRDVDALAKDGPLSLRELVKTLDSTKPVAFVTEGLVNYFDRDRVEQLWRGISAAASPFPAAVLFSDLHVRNEALQYLPARVFIAALGIFARGRVHLHYRDADEASETLHATGFTDVTLHRPSVAAPALGLTIPQGRADLIRLIEAWT
jgi:O-methyltransferase involved in polyketide biosynthesis